MCALSTLLTQGNSGANSSLHFAELAQLVERRLAKAKVAGSNPVFRSNRPGPDPWRSEPGPGLLHFLGSQRRGGMLDEANPTVSSVSSQRGRKACIPMPRPFTLADCTGFARPP